MAQIKKSYGGYQDYIYNTDGSLSCNMISYDVPFSGVRSIALCRASANRVNNTYGPSGQNSNMYNGWTGGSVVPIATERKISNPYGDFCWELTFQANTLGSQYRHPYLGYFFSLEANKLYYLSLYVQNPNNLPLSFLLAGDKWLGNLSRIESRDVGQWQYYRIAVIPSSALNAMWVLIQLSSSYQDTIDRNVLISPLQCVESISEPLVYIHDSQPVSRCRIDTVPDWDNYVISFWTKISRISSNFINPEISFFYVYPLVGNIINANYTDSGYFGVSIQQNSGNLLFHRWVPAGSMQYNIANYGTYEDAWHFVVIALHKEGTTQYFKVYWDGVLRRTLTSASNYNQNVYVYGGNNHLVANLYLGRYRKPNGDIIWTDDYIREVYEAQMPFAVQNQLSIY